MKVVVISDTHNLHSKLILPAGDLLIHCGDFSSFGSVKEIISFNNYLKTLPFDKKLIVPGNHDLLCEKDISLCKSLISNGKLFVDELIEIEGKKFYFSPWTPKFGNWCFMEERESIHRHWGKIPEKTDVLITHGPPHGILDSVMSSFGSISVGCEALRKKVFEIKPRFHLFGHVHEGYGSIEVGGIKFVNAAICNKSYLPVNQPMVIEL